jgi:hypothetical protein
MALIPSILDPIVSMVYIHPSPMPIMSQIDDMAVSCESDHTPECHKTMLNGGYMSGNGAFSEFYVPMVRQSTIEDKEESAFRECFKAMGDSNTCIRYQVKCMYCKHLAVIGNSYPYRSKCLKTGYKMKHYGKPFIVCDFWESNYECIKKAEKGIAKNRVGIGGFVGFRLKR